jgi:hypothetical protein
MKYGLASSNCSHLIPFLHATHHSSALESVYIHRSVGIAFPSDFQQWGNIASYFARVELDNAICPSEYEKPHLALAKHGFTSCGPASRRSLRLPTAFYSGGRVDDIDAVAAAVKDRADSTGRKNEIVVTKHAEIRMYLSSNC